MVAMIDKHEPHDRWCAETNAPYMVGCVVKYICRAHRGQDELADLKNALECLKKLIDLVRDKCHSTTNGTMSICDVITKTLPMTRDYKMDDNMASICLVVAAARTEGNLVLCKLLLSDIIAKKQNAYDKALAKAR